MIVQRLDVDTRGADIGTDEADARIIGVVAKLGVGPSDRTARSEIGSSIVVVDGADAHRAGQVARVLALHLIHIGRRAASRDAHIVGNRCLPHLVTLIASGDGGHHTRIQGCNTHMAQQRTFGNRRIGDAKRHAEHIAAVFHCPLDACGDWRRAATALGVQALDAHQRGIGSHTCLRACRAIATHRACTM